jgi:tetratricopeptide (TPR) repeat protein
MRKWIAKNSKCPLCHTAFDATIQPLIEEYQAYMKQKQAEEDQVKQEADRVAEAEKSKNLAQKYTLEVEAKIAIARGFISAKHYDEAIKVFWDIVDHDIKDKKSIGYSEIILQIGILNYLLGKHAVALNQFSDFIKLDVNHPVAFYYMGLCYEQIGMMDKVQWAFERGLENMKEMATHHPKYESLAYYMELNLN